MKDQTLIWLYNVVPDVDCIPLIFCFVSNHIKAKTKFLYKVALYKITKEKLSKKK